MTDREILTSISSRYAVVELLGKGGMGSVYKAIDNTLQRFVAIKVLSAKCAELNVPRFQREAKTMSTLKHPNLVDVYDFGITDDGFAYLIMEFAVGSLLSEILKTRPLAIDEAILLTLAIARGMEHAHGKGVVHRDLKPENILVADESDFSKIKIFDFGISKAMNEEDTVGELTHTGMLLGTPLYMSPEQALGKNVDQRSDIYSLGCMMYQFLSARPPFEGDTSLDTITMQISQPPESLRSAVPELAIPAYLDLIVMRLLEKEPESRFQSMQEVADALKDGLTSDQRTGTVVVKKAKSSATKIWVSALAVLLLAGAGALAYFNKPEPPPKKTKKAKSHKSVKAKANWSQYFRFDAAQNSYSDTRLDFDINDPVNRIGPIPAQAFALLPDVSQSFLHIRRKLDDEGLAMIAKIDPSGLELRNNGVTNENIGLLNTTKNLKTLCVRHYAITNQGIKNLRIKQLVFLSLENSGVSDGVFPIIAKNFPSLRQLNMGDTGSKREAFTGEGLEALQAIPDLTELSMYHTPITDAKLAKLKLRKLRTLELKNDTYLTDKCLPPLIKNNPELVAIDITGCSPALTKEAQNICRRLGSKVEVKERGKKQTRGPAYEDRKQVLEEVLY